MTANPVVHYTVQVQPGDQLEDLCARWMKLKAAMDTATAEFEDLKAQIKGLAYDDAQAHRPDATRIHIAGMVEVPLVVGYSETRRVSTKLLKSKYPDIYEECRPTEAEVAGKGTWSVREA